VFFLLVSHYSQILVWQTIPRIGGKCENDNKEQHQQDSVMDTIAMVAAARLVLIATQAISLAWIPGSMLPKQ